MDKAMHTKAAEILLKGKFSAAKTDKTEESKVVVVEVLKTGEEDIGYVYKLKHNNKFYILKGYKMCLGKLNVKNQSFIENFLKVLNKIDRIYQEYNSAKYASIFNIHIAKPLILACDIKPPEDEFDPIYLFIEIIFEYGGKSVKEIKPTEVNKIYDLMMQAANALSFLHAMGTLHFDTEYFDIKPENMVYNEEQKLLKVIDMGSTFGSNTVTRVYKETANISDKIHSFTTIYAAPEVIKAYENIDVASEFVPGKLDVYAWAMSAYSILLGRSTADLTFELENYKRGSEAVYADFMAMVDSKLKAKKVSNDEEKKKLLIISKGLLEALKFKPTQRPTMIDIVEKMRAFEKNENVKTSYAEIERNNMNHLATILLLDMGKLQVAQAESKVDLDEEKKQLSQPQAKIEEKVLKETTEKMRTLSKELEETKAKLRAATEELSKEKERCNELQKENGKIIEDFDSVKRQLSQHEEEKSKSKKSTEEKDKKLKELPVMKVMGETNIKVLLAKLKSESTKAYEKVTNECKKINSGRDYCDLYHSCIGDTGAGIVSQKLTNSKTLKYLALGFNKIGIEGAKALAEGLKSCQSLERLYFGQYDYDYDDDYPDYYDCHYRLDDHYRLDRLDHHYHHHYQDSNRFETEGTKALAELLKYSSLKSFDISYCNVSAGAMDAIVDAANSCRTLEWIYIEANSELEGKKYPFRSDLKVEY